MHQAPAPRHELRPPQRQQLRVRLQRDRRPASPVDRRTRPAAPALLSSRSHIRFTRQQPLVVHDKALEPVWEASGCRAGLDAQQAAATGR